MIRKFVKERNKGDYTMSTESTTITVRIVNQYGQRRIQPVCGRAQLFAEIACTATLTDHTIAAIKKLGYTINVERQEPQTL